MAIKMKMAGLLAAVIAGTFIVGFAPKGAAQTVCRDGALATTTCLARPAAPPMPRQLQSDVQGLDRVMRRPQAGADTPDLTPAWRTNRFGDTILPGSAGSRAGPGCRRDSFGNLRC